jgi:hypothetical protein
LSVQEDLVPRSPIKNPGDEVPPGTPQSGERTCRVCGGTGRLDGTKCDNCGGTGRVVVLVGDA